MSLVFYEILIKDPIPCCLSGSYKKMQENEYIFRKKLYLCNRFLLNRETIEDGADGHAGANPVTDEGESLFNNIKNERDIWISNKRF